MVQERDIDMLILEQLHLSPEFVEWLANRVGVPSGTFHSARHSVYRSNGETDVLLFLKGLDGRVAVMIEDKIGAQMQPRQCERYHQRGKELCERGEAIRYTTVLCAPNAYLKSVLEPGEWNHCISFEEIEAWLRRDLSPASVWRQNIIKAAYSKLVRARQADDKSNRQFDTQLVAMKEAYRQFLLRNYANLTASQQTGRDREYYIGARTLPTGIRCKHSFYRGEISIVFEKKWLVAVQPWLTANAPGGSWIHQHGSEIHLRKSTEVMDPTLTVDEQTEILKEALDAVCSLVAVAEQFVRAAT